MRCTWILRDFRGDGQEPICFFCCRCREATSASLQGALIQLTALRAEPSQEYTTMLIMVDDFEVCPRSWTSVLLVSSFNPFPLLRSSCTPQSARPKHRTKLSHSHNLRDSPVDAVHWQRRMRNVRQSGGHVPRAQRHLPLWQTVCPQPQLWSSMCSGGRTRYLPPDSALSSSRAFLLKLRTSMFSGVERVPAILALFLENVFSHPIHALFRRHENAVLGYEDCFIGPEELALLESPSAGPCLALSAQILPVLQWGYPRALVVLLISWQTTFPIFDQPQAGVRPRTRSHRRSHQPPRYGLRARIRRISTAAVATANEGSAHVRRLAVGCCPPRQMS